MGSLLLLWHQESPMCDRSNTDFLLEFEIGQQDGMIGNPIRQGSSETHRLLKGEHIRSIPHRESSPPPFFVPSPKQPVSVSRYVSHVGTSWTLTLISLIPMLVVDFCPVTQSFPIHLQGGGMCGAPCIQTITHCLFASSTSPQLPRCSGMNRWIPGI